MLDGNVLRRIFPTVRVGRHFPSTSVAAKGICCNPTLHAIPLRLTFDFILRVHSLTEQEMEAVP